MKTNLKMQITILKKGLLSLALFFGVSLFAFATATENQTLEEINFQLEFSELKELPSITLVDKNLRIIAEFYGDQSKLKEQFEGTFQKAELLSKHNNQSIYLVINK